METTATFSGTIPEFYDRYLGPAWFDPYAQDLASRLPVRPGGDVLEIACGTGLVTNRLRERLDRTVRLVATDLNDAMLDYARHKYAGLANVDWKPADALKLPFPDASFVATACGFGIMFVPDPTAALREMRRVLKPSGLLVFNVWDRIESNPTGLANAQTVEGLYPGDAQVRFRVPFEMYDVAFLRELLRQAQFRETRIETKRVTIESSSARNVAIGQIRGTPRSLLLEKRGAKLDDVIDKVTVALTRVGGAAPYRAEASAIVIEAVAT